MISGFSKIVTISALLLLGLIYPVMAADVSVSANLARSEIMSGEMAELQVKVTGSQQAEPPQEIPAEGLQIRLTGQSRQMQMVWQNGAMHNSSSVVYSYMVMPLHSGNFTIPPVTVNADGRAFSTPPLSLSVVDAGNGGSATDPASQMPSQIQQPLMPGFTQQPVRTHAQRDDGAQIAFGEISCPKKTLYAGEITPVEIRYYFDARYPVQVQGRVNFGGEGILVERFPDPKEGREERNGVTYNVLSFHSLLSAVKPGSLDIVPAKLESQIQMPGGMPAGFDDPVFQQLMGQAGGSQTRELTVKTAPLHLEVLPLPKEGRPDSFAGAVGEFDIDASIPNRRPAPGDPVDLIVKISGKGNFKGMGAPILTNADGWRSYPPGDKFEASDELSYSGVKSFDFTLIAQQPQHLSPGSEFSYFDPVTAKYVTLTTKPMALEASPGNSAPPAIPGISPTPPVATPTPAPAATPNDGNPLPELTLHSWKTPVQRSGFLIFVMAMLVVTAALAVVLYLRNIRAGGGTPAMRRRRHLAELWSQVNSDSVDAATAYDAAVEYAALVAPPSDAREEEIVRIAGRRDLLKYGRGGSTPLIAEEREKLLAALKKLSSP